MTRLLLSALVAGCTGGTLPPGDPGRPDVVLVSIDTLRADHLGAWGHVRDTSPFLDRLAAQGVRFADCRSPSPWTLPAHATLLSGQRPGRHGVVDDDIRLPEGLPWLPSVLAEAGFATGGFVATLYVSRKYSFERDFEVFDDFGIQTAKENLAGEVVAADVVDRALRWLRGLPPGQPAFLFVHVYDAHYAYDPPAPFDTLFDRAPRRGDLAYRSYEWHRKHPVPEAQLAHQVAQYDEAIRYVDTELARLHEALVGAGRAATWVVTADHGEEFGERGSWGHAHTLYPEQLHVPLIVAGARVPAARVVDAPVGLEDVAPSLAALAGQSLAGADGVDLEPVVTGTAEPPPRGFLAETSRFSSNRLGWLEDGWRLDLDLKTGTRTLFHRATDPKERLDLATEAPDRVARMERELLEALGTPWFATAEVEVRTPGYLVLDGALVGHGATVPAGARFQVLPLDAHLRVAGARWRAPTEPPPTGAPLGWTGGAAVQVELTPEQRKRLEALGYVE